MYCLLFRNFESPASLCSPQKRRKTTIQWWLFSVWLLFFFFSVGYTHTLKSHHCMVVVVFLLFCGLHNEAGDSKFRKGRQYIAYVGHIGEKNNISKGKSEDSIGWSFFVGLRYFNLRKLGPTNKPAKGWPKPPTMRECEYILSVS